MIVLDASVLIAHLDGNDALHDRASALLTAVAEESFGASVLTLAEVLVGPSRAGKAELAESALRQLGVAPLALDSTVARTLAALRASTGVKLPDCCVLLAAETVGAAMATFDDRLAAAARRRGVPVHP